MRATFITVTSSLLCTLARTQRLDKPPLAPSLDYLQRGLLEYLPPVPSSYEQWTGDWIPSDCKTLAEGSNMSAADVETFNVRYDDVGGGDRLCIFCLFLSNQGEL